ncbi:MAG: MCE family protein [Nitrococcus mobilis]|nr:MCE family protein [Nitrococcus mobilis]
MGSRVSYTLVGLFVVLLTIGLVAGGLWFAGGLKHAGQFQRYSVYTTGSVAGLTPGAGVTYKGIGVGKVVRIAIDHRDPKRVHVVLAVAQSTPINTATRAAFKPRGLTGATSVELSGYAASAAPLSAPPGEPYPVIRSKQSPLTQLDEAVSESIGTLNQIGKQFEELLSEHNRQAIAGILADFARLSDTLAANSAHIEQTLVSLDQIMQNSAQITHHIPKTLEQLERSLQGLDHLSRSLDQTAISLTGLGRSGETGINRVLRTTVPELKALFTQIRRTTSHLDHLIQKLEREPAALLRGTGRRPAGPGEE